MTVYVQLYKMEKTSTVTSSNRGSPKSSWTTCRLPKVSLSFSWIAAGQWAENPSNQPWAHWFSSLRVFRATVTSTWSALGHNHRISSRVQCSTRALIWPKQSRPWKHIRLILVALRSSSRFRTCWRDSLRLLGSTDRYSCWLMVRLIIRKTL